MPQFTNSVTTTVPIGQNVPFTETPVRCTKGCVMHREGSGLITLRGPANGCRARYLVTFDANIAVATGGTVGPIGVAIAVDGEPLYSATAIVTPAAIGDFFNVAATAIVDVPCGCCVSIAVENVLPPTGTAPGTSIDVANASIVVERTA